MIDAATGLQHIHFCEVIHRDIKPGNIMVKGNKTAIADFGVAFWKDFARAHGETISVKTMESQGTQDYMAPNVQVSKPKYCTRDDVYSFGITLLETFFFTRILNDLAKIRRNIGSSLADPLKKRVSMLLDFIQGMCDSESKMRPEIGAAKTLLECLLLSCYEYEDFEDKLVSEGFDYLQTQVYSSGDAVGAVRGYVHKATGMEFVLVPGGSFVMGSPKTEKGRNDFEGPRREVVVKPFLISKYTVTQSVWQKEMGDTPWKNKDYVKEGDNFPATYVSWDDCQEFCKKTGLLLPSEAQWEYACRAGTKTRYYFDDNESKLGDYAWYDKNARNIGEEYAHEVGQKKPNAFGLYDMLGNVWEWCEDDWSDNYEKTPRDGIAHKHVGSSFAVNRGGSFFDPAENGRCADRGGGSRDRRDDGLGFRVLKPAP